MITQLFRWGFVTGMLLAAMTHVAYSDWSSFRNGGSSSTSSKLPESWAPDSKIAWQRELAGYGQSAPVVWKDSVYVTSVQGDQKEEAVVTCLDRTKGEVKWTSSIRTAQQAPSNYMNSRAAPTPTVDKAGVYSFFESGDLVAFNHSGEKLWALNLVEKYGPITSNHGLGSSPTQTDQAVILNVEHNGPSYLIAVDKKSGEILWQVDRPSGSSWSSPVVRNGNSGDEVIVSSQGSITGYDVTSGKQTWQVTGLEGNTVPSPVYEKGRLIVGARLPEFGSARAAIESNLCLELNSQLNEDPTVAWRCDGAVCDYASPVIAGNCVYFLTKTGVLHCVDFKTGTSHYRERLNLECWSTPVVSGNRVYFIGKNGESKVIAAGPEFRLISSSQLWDPENPPAPEQYVEAQGGGHGHSHQASDSSEKTESPDENQAKQQPGGRFARMLLASDANQNGQLEADEIPERFAGMLKGGDLDQDGILDSEEIAKMAESFRKRREGSRQSSRDPIVYGVAATDGQLFIRTGTRLFCVGGEEE